MDATASPALDAAPAGSAPAGSDPAGSDPAGATRDFYSGWRRLVFLQALVAFLSLVATGELPAWVVATFLAAWAIGWRVRLAPSFWRPWMAFVATAAILVPIGLRMRAEFFPSVLKVILFLTLAKCFALRTARDHLQAQVLCFFLVLSTAVITVDFHFSFFFVAYSTLAALGMAHYAIGVGHERALPGDEAARERRMRRSRWLVPPPEIRAGATALPRRFRRTGALLATFFVLLVAFLFFFIPHLSLETLDAPLSARSLPPERLTGFSEEVEFGHFKELTPDSTVVMQVEPASHEGSDFEPPPELRLRGLALEHYDEIHWGPSPARNDVRVEQNISDLRGFNVQTLQKSPLRSGWLEIYQNPQLTMRVFTTPWPISVDFFARRNVRVDYNTVSISVTSLGTSRESTYTNPFRYKVSASLAPDATHLMGSLREARLRRREITEKLLPLADDPAAREALLERADKETRRGIGRPAWAQPTAPPKAMTAEDRLINLQLPDTELTTRIERFAREIVGPGRSDAETVDALCNLLRDEYEYTLTPGLPDGVHPIDAFLFRTKRGHCEYFATALVLMLRSLGVPARLVNGFYTTDWNELSEVYIVRQSDAHAWAEVWFDEVGWLTIDPTPPGNAGRAAYGRGGSGFFAKWNDYLRIQWQRFVIDYSIAKQANLMDQLKNAPGFGALLRGAGRLREMAGSESKRPNPLLSPDESRRDAYLRLIGDAGAAVATLGTLALAATLLAKLARRRRRVRARSGLRYFDAVIDRLERLGRRRAPGQTPAELVRTLPASAFPVDDLERVVAVYYRQRYGGEPPSESDLDLAREVLRRLREESRRSVRIKTDAASGA